MFGTPVAKHRPVLPEPADMATDSSLPGAMFQVRPGTIWRRPSSPIPKTFALTLDGSMSRSSAMPAAIDSQQSANDLSLLAAEPVAVGEGVHGSHFFYYPEPLC